MPRAYLMSWEAHPNYRWVKMFKGERHRVTCAELGFPHYTDWTKEATASAANAWWLKTRSELEQQTNRSRYLERDSDGQSSTPILDSLERVDKRLEYASKYAPEELDRLTKTRSELETLDPETYDGLPHEDDPSIQAKLDELKVLGHDLSDLDPLAIHRYFSRAEVHEERRRIKPETGERRFSFGSQVDRWLEMKRGGTKPQTFRELSIFVKDFKNAQLGARRILHPELDLSALTEGLVSEVRSWIDRTQKGQNQKKKRWGRFVSIVKWFHSEHVISELPRNLDQDYQKFTVDTEEVEPIDPKFVRDIFGELPERLQLYALLGLNCGMTNVDIGNLTQTMVDWDAGTITRKRIKTEKVKKVPKVTYKLWPKTFALLTKHRANHPTFALTSMDNTPLYNVFMGVGDDGKEKVKKTDLVSSQWKREMMARQKEGKPTLVHKAFRSVSSSAIEHHELYGRYKTHFLGHAPTSVAEKYYAAPSQPLFDTILAWLEGQLFPS